jgi:hypothetical protein
VFPVRYGLNSYILFRRNSCFNVCDQETLVTGRNPGEGIHIGPNTDASWQLDCQLQLDWRQFSFFFVREL